MEHDTIVQLARDTLEYVDHAALKHIQAWETGDDEALKELFNQP